MSRLVTLQELDALQQLKVVRYDNPIYQKLLKTYYNLVVQAGDLQSSINMYELENQELSNINDELQDEINSMRDDHSVLEKQSRQLQRSIKNFIKDLKENGDDQLELFDASI